MNKEILNPEIQSFVTANLDTDIVSLLLKNTLFNNVTIQEIAEQIEAKKKCKNKLPSWYNNSGIYYPNKLNIEQTSSEITATYKAKITNGKSLIDLTGGFGVDCFYFSKKIDKVIHCEINKNLSEIATHNYAVLGVKNIINKTKNGVEFLKESTKTFDWIYIDPSRRHDQKGKVFMLSDCLPDVPKHLSQLFEKSTNILIKTSPLLDFSIGINELNSIKEIHVVAIKNEVKEILWVLEKDYKNSILIKTVNITKPSTEILEFHLSEEKAAISNFSLPQKYLYEPNAAILKSGAFKTIGNKLRLNKLQEHAHLYTSDELLKFPGRCFKIEKTMVYNKKELQQLNLKKANITTRNFPESVANIRKKFKIKDGGETYLFFTKDMSGKLIVLACSKVL
ncbi:MAG: class I SAM-dependent methyltransferase [Cellulophaga sp.]